MIIELVPFKSSPGRDREAVLADARLAIPSDLG
jgi:hypothetical protein